MGKGLRPAPNQTPHHHQKKQRGRHHRLQKKARNRQVNHLRRTHRVRKWHQTGSGKNRSHLQLPCPHKHYGTQGIHRPSQPAILLPTRHDALNGRNEMPTQKGSSLELGTGAPKGARPHQNCPNIGPACQTLRQQPSHNTPHRRIEAVWTRIRTNAGARRRRK